MFKQSPRRNQRNKGIKVKHVMQVCLLIGIGIWLLYQVQHSRDKGKSSHENAKILEKIQNGDNYMKLGRKDLQPRIEEDTEDEKQKDDQLEERVHSDDESKPEDKEQEQENKEESEHGERAEESEGKEERAYGGEDKENDEKETMVEDGREKVKEKENVEPDVEGDNVENEGGSTKMNRNEEKNDERNDANESNEIQSEEATESKDNLSAETTEENEMGAEETKEKEGEDSQEKHDSDQEERKDKDREKRNEKEEKNELEKQKDGSIEKTSLEEEGIHGRTHETNKGGKDKNREEVMVSSDIAKTKQVSTVKNAEAGSNTKQNEFEDTINNNSEITKDSQIEEPLDSDDSSPKIAEKSDSNSNSGTRGNLKDSPNNVESRREDRESKTASGMEKDSEYSAASESNNSAENKNSDNDMKMTSFININGTDVGQSRSESSSDISDSSSNEEVSPTAAAHDDHIDSSTSLPQEEKEAQVDSSTSLPQEEKEARTDLDTLPDTGTEGNNHDAIAK